MPFFTTPLFQGNESNQQYKSLTAAAAAGGAVAGQPSNAAQEKRGAGERAEAKPWKGGENEKRGAEHVGAAAGGGGGGGAAVLAAGGDGGGGGGTCKGIQSSCSGVDGTNFSCTEASNYSMMMIYIYFDRWSPLLFIKFICCCFFLKKKFVC